MPKNSFKLKAAFKTNNPNVKKVVKAPTQNDENKKNYARNDFEMKLLALKERNTKQNNAQKAVKKPIVLAQPIFVLPTTQPAESGPAEFQSIDALLPAESPSPAVTAANTSMSAIQQASLNKFKALSEDAAPENSFKINLKPSAFSLPPRTGGF